MHEFPSLLESIWTAPAAQRKLSSGPQPRAETSSCWSKGVKMRAALTRVLFWSALVTALGLFLPTAPAFSQPIPGVATVSDKRFEFPAPPAGPVEMVQLVLDFPAGGAVPPHTHGGPVYVTV